jgi:hypothetical protein
MKGRGLGIQKNDEESRKNLSIQKKDEDEDEKALVIKAMT